MFGKLFVSLSRSVYISVYNIYNAWAHQTTHNKSFVTFGWCEREEEWENPDKNQRGRAVLSVSLKKILLLLRLFSSTIPSRSN